MASGDTPQQRLARAVRDRREQLRLSVRAAAKAAPVSRNTWQSLEEGDTRTQDRNFAAIEGALEWPAGHIRAILEARTDEPTVPRPTLGQLQAMSVEEFGELQRRIVKEEGMAAADAHLEEVRALYASEARKVPPRR